MLRAAPAPAGSAANRSGLKDWRISVELLVPTSPGVRVAARRAFHEYFTICSGFVTKFFHFPNGS
jgi:hypothetical protein